MLEALVTGTVKTEKKEAVSENFAEVDDAGRLILPKEIAAQFGLKAGDELFVETGEDSFRLHRPVTRPARIYVEATTRCNMDCAMCQRHAWEDAPADMDRGLFEKIVAYLETANPVPGVVLGGFGEPLMHPDIVPFIQACKAREAPVELISNGLMLTRARLAELKNAGLDRIWLSVDGVAEPSGGHVRNREAFARLVNSLKTMTAMSYYAGENSLRLGFVFVAMKDNIHEFPKVMELARSLNVDRIIVSNLLPYTADGLDQILYQRSTWQMGRQGTRIKLPRMDLWGEAPEILVRGMAGQDMGDLLNSRYKEPMDTCPFMKKASVSVGWDGRVSPCPPLLHTHSCYFQEVERKNRECSFGNLQDGTLLDIWNDTEYADFRKRVKAFDFSPCVSCASCHLPEANEEDCTGNTFPTCGGCLWAQGLIQCP